MDSLRGKFGLSDGAGDDVPWEDGPWEDGTDESDFAVDEAPPGPVGQDERRMQVRAYNYWASLLGERTFPSVEDIEPDTLPDFAENSVLLDFTGGIENPAIAYLGARLAGECGDNGPIRTLDDVPGRSLLSRITDHYLQILANEAPVGFEAEFINRQGVTILYRGILLPFSTDDETIDFVYGVINWKEVADQLTTDELLLEIDQALADQPDEEPGLDVPPRRPARAVVAPPVTRWADGPGAGSDGDADQDGAEDNAQDTAEGRASLPRPSFARLDMHPGLGDAADAREVPAAFDPASPIGEPSCDAGLHACLEQARELAEAAYGAEVRSRAALYEAIGRAYDVSLAAQAEPETYQGLLEVNAIAVAPRAPMTPVVKLVFGVDYDKSRVAEYAAVLAFAHREGVARGGLAQVIENTEGGIRSLVARERAVRRANGPAPAQAKHPRYLKRLGQLEGKPLAAIPADGAAYSLCLIRRDEAGEIAFLGEIADDEHLLARAARHLLG